MQPYRNPIESDRNRSKPYWNRIKTHQTQLNPYQILVKTLLKPRSNLNPNRFNLIGTLSKPIDPQKKHETSCDFVLEQKTNSNVETWLDRIETLYHPITKNDQDLMKPYTLLKPNDNPIEPC